MWLLKEQGNVEKFFSKPVYCLVSKVHHTNGTIELWMEIQFFETIDLDIFVHINKYQYLHWNCNRDVISKREYLVLFTEN